VAGGFQVAVLELGHGLLDLAQRCIDRAAHAQRQQGGEHQPAGNQQQAGEQAAIAAQQHVVVGQFQFDPAQQAMGFVGNDVARQVAMAAKDREQIARGVVVGALQQLRAVAQRCLIEHDRAGVGQGFVIGVEERHGPHVLLLQGLGGDAFQQGGVVPPRAGATSGASCSAIISPRCSSWDCSSDCCTQVK
jgi:hypothetical protein